MVSSDFPCIPYSCCRLQRYFCKIIFSKWIREFSQSDVCFFCFFCFFFKWILCWNDEWSRLWPFHCIHITVFNDASWFTLTDCCCCWVFMLHLPNVVYLYCCSKNALNGSKNVFCFVFLSGFWEMSSDDVNAFSTSHLLFLSWDVLWVHCVPSIIQSLFLSFCLSTLQWICLSAF